MKPEVLSELVWTGIESFFLPCINPQAPLHTVSWNWHKSRQTCIWTRLDFLSSLSGSNLIVAGSAYGTQKGRPEKLRTLLSLYKSSGLVGWPLQGWASTEQNDVSSSLNQSPIQKICCFQFHGVYLITINGAQPCTVLKNQDLQFCKNLGQIFFFLISI